LGNIEAIKTYTHPPRFLHTGLWISPDSKIVLHMIVNRNSLVA
jgi:hypothetical protein